MVKLLLKGVALHWNGLGSLQSLRMENRKGILKPTGLTLFRRIMNAKLYYLIDDISSIRETRAVRK